MKRKKHNARKRFRRIMKGISCNYDGNSSRHVDMYHPNGRRLTNIEAEAVAYGAWKWAVEVTVRARMGELLRWESREFEVDQWVRADDLGPYIDDQGQELADSLPTAWVPEAVIWKAVIVG